MKVYQLERKQHLPITLEQAWSFFSTPSNLEKLTPSNMKFNIHYNSGLNEMYAGQIITYKIKVPPGINMDWTTEITHVEPLKYFVDEQRFGPYKMWHHQHRFTETEEGVVMEDIVNYVMPFGFIGRIAHAVFVKRQLKDIFDYRIKSITAYIEKELS